MRGTVPLASDESFTSSDLCGLGLLGGSLLGLGIGLIGTKARDKLGWCWTEEGSSGQNGGWGTVPLLGRPLANSGLCLFQFF